EKEDPIDILEIDNTAVRNAQLERLEKLRAERNEAEACPASDSASGHPPSPAGLAPTKPSAAAGFHRKPETVVSKRQKDKTTKRPNDETTKRRNDQTTKRPNDQTTKRPTAAAGASPASESASGAACGKSFAGTAGSHTRSRRLYQVRTRIKSGTTG
ncbi:MAG: hypothetical protein R6V61_05050, partial [Wenzhouxiangellaceae bacterium]